jgi:hypothetical protein
MSYMRRKRSTPDGSVVELNLYYAYKAVPTDPHIREKRAARVQEISEAQRAGNLRRAISDLAMRIASNFKRDDWYVTLTSRRKWSIEEAKTAWHDFINHVRKIYRKAGAVLKYVGTMEKGKRCRPHFHVLLNAAPPDVLDQLRDLWKHGILKIELYNGTADDAADVAAYMKKELGTRIMASHTLEKPVIRKERVARSECWRPKVKIPAGYHVNERLSYRGYTADGYPMQHIIFVRD